MNKEYRINSDSTVSVYEQEGNKNELTSHTYEILQTENTIEYLRDKIVAERVSKDEIFAKMVGFTVVAVIVAIVFGLLLVLLPFLGIETILEKVLMFIVLSIFPALDVAVVLDLVDAFKNKKYMDTNLAIYEEQLALAKSKLEELKRTAVKLTPEQVQNLDALKAVEIGEDENLTKLKSLMLQRYA